MRERGQTGSGSRSRPEPQDVAVLESRSIAVHLRQSQKMRRGRHAEEGTAIPRLEGESPASRRRQSLNTGHRTVEEPKRNSNNETVQRATGSRMTGPFSNIIQTPSTSTEAKRTAVSRGTADQLVFKILRPVEWSLAMQLGEYRGSAVDHKDGFIHLSA